MPLKMQKARRFRRASLLGQSTFSPLAVSTKTDPSISAAPRHISIRPRKISKYSYIEQMAGSISRSSEMTFFSGSMVSFWLVTA